MYYCRYSVISRYISKSFKNLENSSSEITHNLFMKIVKFNILIFCLSSWTDR